ncbi:hypothetical protein ACC731_37430, partial [Rhizobium ruizarguesonis]
STKRLRDELDDPQAAFHDLARDGQRRRAATEESLLHAHNDPCSTYEAHRCRFRLQLALPRRKMLADAAFYRNPTRQLPSHDRYDDLYRDFAGRIP